MVNNFKVNKQFYSLVNAAGLRYAHLSGTWIRHWPGFLSVLIKHIPPPEVRKPVRILESTSLEPTALRDPHSHTRSGLELAFERSRAGGPNPTLLINKTIISAVRMRHSRARSAFPGYQPKARCGARDVLDVISN